MNKLKLLVLSLVIVSGVSLYASPGVVQAGPIIDSMKGSLGEVGGNEGNNTRSIGDIVQIIAGALLFIVGGLAVIMIIYSGFKYVTSGGDAATVKAAKDILVYAIIGLAVAVLAYAVVTFVVDLATGTGSQGEDELEEDEDTSIRASEDEIVFNFRELPSR